MASKSIKPDAYVTAKLANLKGKRGGRKLGAVNAVQASVKANIQAVFNGLGGTSAMKAWAARYPTDYYRIYAKLLPHEISGVDGAPISLSFEPPDKSA